MACCPFAVLPEFVLIMVKNCLQLKQAFSACLDKYSLGSQDKEKALKEATQAALEASSAAEAQHAAMSRQLAADKRKLQEQLDQVVRSNYCSNLRHCMSTRRTPS